MIVLSSKICVLSHYDYAWNRFLDRTTFDNMVIKYGLPSDSTRPTLPPMLFLDTDLQQSQDATVSSPAFPWFSGALAALQSRLAGLFSSF